MIMTVAAVTLTVEALVGIIIAFAALLTAIGVISKNAKDIKNSFKNSIKEIVKEELEVNNVIQDEKLDIKLKHMAESNTREIEVLKESFTCSNKQLGEKIDIIVDKEENFRREQLATNGLLKEALIEAYKHDIRDIYYRLRNTGDITDAEKSYIDKIFPKYKAIGGNSDIEAKYGEICRVYERRTQEQFDLARDKKKTQKKTKNTKSSHIEAEDEDTVEEIVLEENKTVVES